MKNKNMPFMDAIKFLADRSNIVLEEEARVNPTARKKELLYKVNVEAGRFFYSNLRTNKNAKEYFLNRGIEKKLLKSLD